jgi:hypothetical protein
VPDSSSGSPGTHVAVVRARVGVDKRLCLPSRPYRPWPTFVCLFDPIDLKSGRTTR